MKEEKQMLSFVDALKRIIADIEVTGGAAIERTFPSHQLMQQLREYAVQCFAETPGNSSLGEWFFEGYFEEHVRACVIYLHKLGISDADRVYHFLTQVIEKMVKGHAGNWEGQESLEKQLVRSLEIVWYECGDEQTSLYRATESRWLITWDYQKSKWKATGLGRLFMDLTPVKATIFFLSIDTLFATGEYDFHHFSSEVLRRLQSLKPDDEMQFIERLDDTHYTLLTRLGIFIQVKPGVDRERSSADRDSYVQVTPLGQMVLNAVLSENNVYRDVALAVLQTEEVGGTFSESAAEISEMVRLVNQSDLVDQVNRASVDTSVELYQAGKSLASFETIYPSMEAILGTMLIRAGKSERLNKLGMVEKARRLRQEGIIPPDVAGGIEVVAKARNQVAHGSISPPDEDARFFCQLAYWYLRRLLTTYHPVN